MLPQVTRMFTQFDDIDNLHEKRRAIIVESAKLIANQVVSNLNNFLPIKVINVYRSS